MAPAYSTRILRGMAAGIREFPVFGNQKRTKLWVDPFTDSSETPDLKKKNWER